MLLVICLCACFEVIYPVTPSKNIVFSVQYLNLLVYHLKLSWVLFEVVEKVLNSWLHREVVDFAGQDTTVNHNAFCMTRLSVEMIILSHLYGVLIFLKVHKLVKPKGILNLHYGRTLKNGSLDVVESPA